MSDIIFKQSLVTCTSTRPTYAEIAEALHREAMDMEYEPRLFNLLCDGADAIEELMLKLDEPRKPW